MRSLQLDERIADLLEEQSHQAAALRWLFVWQHLVCWHDPVAWDVIQQRLQWDSAERAARSRARSQALRCLDYGPSENLVPVAVQTEVMAVDQL